MQFTNEKVNKDLAEVGRMLREEFWLLGVLLFVFAIFFPVDMCVCTTVYMYLHELYVSQIGDVGMFVQVGGALVHIAVIIVGFSVIGVIPYYLWGWRKNWGQMVQIWKQNMKTSFAPVGDIPFKRKVIICLVWLYIMVRILCIVVYLMPSSGMIASEVYEMLSNGRLSNALRYLPASCFVTLFIVETVLFYLAVQVPLLHKTKMDSGEENV